jgi:5-formyltetrahydrofolate cyclo-ligase
VTKLKMNITTKEDLKAENEKLKRKLSVLEKGVKHANGQLASSIPYEQHKKIVKDLKMDYEEAQDKSLILDHQKKEYVEKYHKEHSLVIQLDGEVENLREQLRQSREESVKYGKENEHLWGLLKIKMEG